MHRFLPVIAAALVIFPTSRLTTAQLLNKDAPIIASHYHLNVTNVAEHRNAGWTRWEEQQQRSAPTKPTSSSSGHPAFPPRAAPDGPDPRHDIDHIGFAVLDVPQTAAKAVANGYALTVGREPDPGRP